MSKKLTTDEFITRAKSIHGDKYGYSESEYINARTKVKIFCKTCNEFFYQTPDKHTGIRKDGCPMCANINNGLNKRLSLHDIIHRSKITNHNRYDYSITEYSTYHNKIKFICPNHGIVEQYVKHHINGVGCPICRESKGEQKIRLYLESNNIKYTHQHTFNTCTHSKPLPFDFYIVDKNICIEFDGEQHYKPARYSTDTQKMIDKLSIIQLRDSIKTKYCIDNNIRLLRIPYWDFNNINEILKRELI